MYAVFNRDDAKIPADAYDMYMRLQGWASIPPGPLRDVQVGRFRVSMQNIDGPCYMKELPEGRLEFTSRTECTIVACIFKSEARPVGVSLRYNLSEGRILLL